MPKWTSAAPFASEDVHSSVDIEANSFPLLELNSPDLPGSQTINADSIPRTYYSHALWKARLDPF